MIAATLFLPFFSHAVPSLEQWVGQAPYYILRLFTEKLIDNEINSIASQIKPAWLQMERVGKRDQGYGLINSDRRCARKACWARRGHYLPATPHRWWECKRSRSVRPDFLSMPLIFGPTSFR